MISARPADITLPGCPGCGATALRRVSDHWQCAVCGGRIILRPDGSVKPWLDIATAGRSRRPRIRRKR